ncbi:hypothetical protein B0T20DRAFT_397827 [Sordaria brevicollis]|uniref:Uncharacterized protein n=1 Tax=Sordaria brevicollis TaxID=83679 RepID=A0AAE0U2M6_SORBR|nr:hypothetical protein B0T20DRAFT_397827 [Sordaria brevicollis]
MDQSLDLVPWTAKEVDREEACDNFMSLLEADCCDNNWNTKLAVRLQAIAMKYRELAGNCDDLDWHEYFEMSFLKFLLDVPESPDELKVALKKLNEVEAKFAVSKRGVDVEVVSNTRDASAGGDDLVLAKVAKKVVEYLADDNNEERPSKRIKLEGQKAGIFELKEDDTPCTIRVLSRDGKSAKLDITVQDTGDSNMIVKIHKKDGGATITVEL